MRIKVKTFPGLLVIKPENKRSEVILAALPAPKIYLGPGQV